MSVDFPAPFSPMRASTSPRRNSRLTPSSANTPGKRLEIDCIRRMGGSAGISGGYGFSRPKYGLARPRLLLQRLEVLAELFDVAGLDHFHARIDQIVFREGALALGGQFVER